MKITNQIHVYNVTFSSGNSDLQMRLNDGTADHTACYSIEDAAVKVCQAVANNIDSGVMIQIHTKPISKIEIYRGSDPRICTKLTKEQGKVFWTVFKEEYVKVRKAEIA